MSQERPVSEFLALLTREWVAYGSEGVSLRADIHEIARAHGGDLILGPDRNGMTSFVLTLPR